MMQASDIFWLVVWAFALSPVLCWLCYVAARGASAAYFKAKLEHFRSVTKEIGGSDGKG